MSLHWMDVQLVDYSDIPLDSEDGTRSWDFLKSCLFLAGSVVWVQRSVRSLVMIACFGRPFLLELHKLSGQVV